MIDGLQLPSIGFIRAKPLATGGFVLAIYPPGSGALAGVAPATVLELVVGEAEVERITRVAPHLISSGWQNAKTANRRKTVVSGREKTPGKAPKPRLRRASPRKGSAKSLNTGAAGED